DGTDLLAMPGLVNAHTHAAMTLFRGYGDDMPLMPWLQERIWPAEAKLTDDDVYWGTRLACAEMIRTGTTLFNDMYWKVPNAVRAIADSGLRATVSGGLISGDFLGDLKGEITELIAKYEGGEFPDRVRLAIAPHAVYTVTPEDLEWCAQLASDHDLPIQIHLSETLHEVEECVATHGVKPTFHLKRHGILDRPTTLAHGVWLERDELELLADHPATVVHNPVSNLKLACGQGREVRGWFDYPTAKVEGVNVALATDGTASNTNLDMFEEMKFASLMAKHASGDPTCMPAAETLDIATRGGADGMGWTDAGRLEVGALADIVLVSMREVTLTPVHDPVSHVVYAANGGTVHTTICDGQVLMEDGRIEGLEEVRARAIEAARRVTTG
ncbi:MAG: amidohydrolase, partial [marine benthic group bacterium]|nr:amidohydrolase [Gemmatimonadota bacterium]